WSVPSCPCHMSCRHDKRRILRRRLRYGGSGIPSAFVQLTPGPPGVTAMASSTVVAAARRALGPVGAYLPVPFASGPSVQLQRQAVRRLEAAGYRTAWVNEGGGGKDALVQIALLLAATERMTLGAGIANIWARPPQTAHGAAALLAQAYPGRFVLGLGVVSPFQATQVGRDFGCPLATIREYFEQMTAEQPMAQVPPLTYPRILAA